MKAPAEKTPDTQRQAAAHEAPHQPVGAEAEYEFVDNREETTDLRQLQEVADKSPQAQGLAQLSAMMNNSPRSAAMQNLQAKVDNSPRQVAQRQQHNGIQGATMGLQVVSRDVPVQRVEDEELLQGGFAAESPVQLAQPPDEKPNNTGLPDHLKAGVESLSGLSLDNVKVHYNSSEPAQLNAHAYAQGTDIHLGPGQEQHLPHETWHVVQQAQGRVKPTVQMKDGVGVNDDVGLEREADLMGAKAMREESTSNFISLNKANSQSHPPIIQPKWEYDSFKKSEQKGILIPAVEKFTSSVKYTTGPGVALFRMADSDDTLFMIQFLAVKKGKGICGDTDLLFKSGDSVVGLYNEKVHIDPDVATKAKEGLKIVITINTDADDNKTVGGVINTLVHEFAVHAVEYYQTIKTLLQEDDPIKLGDEIKRYKTLEGVGETPIKKTILNMNTGGDAIETKKGRAEHSLLGQGGSKYYKDLVKDLMDEELNSWFGSSTLNDFTKAQAKDVRNHQLLYDSVKYYEFKKNNANAHIIGNSMDENERNDKMSAISESSSAWSRTADGLRDDENNNNNTQNENTTKRNDGKTMDQGQEPERTALDDGIEKEQPQITTETNQMNPPKLLIMEDE